MGSYTFFVKTNHCKIDFVIPDSACADYIGAYREKKFDIINGMINMVPISLFYEIKAKMTKHDYAIFPLSKNTAVLCVNPDGTIKDYTFNIKQLSHQDVCVCLNHLMLENAESHVAFADRGKLG